MDTHLSLLDDVIEMALTAGASAADAIVTNQSGIKVQFRKQALEKTGRTDSQSLSVRVFCGQKTASFSSSDLSRASLKQMVSRSIQIAQEAPDNPLARLVEPDDLFHGGAIDLDLSDGTELNAKDLSHLAKELEASLLSVDGVEQSSGAAASMSQNSLALKTTNGFSNSYHRTSFGLSAGAVASNGREKATGAFGLSSRFFEDLETPQEIGLEAGRRAASKLGSFRARAGMYPVVIEKHKAASLIGILASAISGPQVARGMSFLRDRLEHQIFPSDIQIIDDPHIKRGQASRLFDGEGVACKPIHFVEDGVLAHWATNAESATQLKHPLTGHGTPLGSSVSFSNFYMKSGDVSVDAMIADIDYGLFVTDFLGNGTNLLTGQISQAVSGFIIENGEISRPFKEATIAGSVLNMFRRVVPANDLELRAPLNAPTLRFEGLTVSG